MRVGVNDAIAPIALAMVKEYGQKAWSKSIVKKPYCPLIEPTIGGQFDGRLMSRQSMRGKKGSTTYVPRGSFKAWN